METLPGAVLCRKGHEGRSYKGWEQPLVMTLLSLMAVVVMSIKPKPLRSWLKRPFLRGLTIVLLFVLGS